MPRFPGSTGRLEQGPPSSGMFHSIGESIMFCHVKPLVVVLAGWGFGERSSAPFENMVERRGLFVDGFNEVLPNVC